MDKTYCEFFKLEVQHLKLIREHLIIFIKNRRAGKDGIKIRHKFISILVIFEKQKLERSSS